ANAVGIVRGSANHPDMGRHALAGLLDAHAVRWLFPSPEEIIAFEDYLIDQSEELLETAFERDIYGLLEAEFGLIRDEYRMVVRMAQNRMLADGVDADLQRVLIMRQLQNYVKRSREVNDMTAELRGIKQMAQVAGVTRTQPEDAASALINAARDYSRRVKELPAQRITGEG
ncbi:MAG: hypothetical protein AAF085_14610, partial [Planctomycetota bacterium]